MIPPTRGWVAQWQSVPHVWGSPGFDPRSGLFFLFLQERLQFARLVDARENGADTWLVHRIEELGVLV